MPTFPPSPVRLGRHGERPLLDALLNGTLPVARAGGDENHLRASYGRAVAEAAFWTPAALLPQYGVRWEETDEPNRVRAIITHDTLEQTIEIAMAEDGRPI